MDGKAGPKQPTPEQQQAGGGAGSYDDPNAGQMQGEGEIPCGWYYFGPEPPVIPAYGNGPQYQGGGAGMDAGQTGGPGAGQAAGHDAGQSAGQGAGYGPGGNAFGQGSQGQGSQGQGGPGHGGQSPGYDENAAHKEAFERLSRGNVDAETIAKLLSLDERDFWKGALVGAGAALLATNLPALKAMLAGALAAATPDKGGQSEQPEPDKDKPVEPAAKENET
ncbi:hypothetical protein V6C03_08390 [Methyloligella sp. 2.7D]|uniref:hypothetical protein n=1 Tax=unclassified Methyloligella TaxID=2625955 RepID=UPI00157BEC9A|nr:hypothetical protein [Methyloligella sp. GL2]QKP78111.1 hypothetical protein HT051_12060 [Methyloligella sp. GL2]